VNITVTDLFFLSYISGFLVFIVSLVFAEMSRQENYFPRPWMNYLSWSYGFNVMSGFCSSFGGICLFIMAMILKEKLFTESPPKLRHEDQYKPSSHGSGSIAPPPTEKSKSESFV